MAKWALIILGFAAGLAVAETSPPSRATMGVSVIVVDPKTPPPAPPKK
jgi:hypothetical protein